MFLPHPWVHQPCTVCGQAISNDTGLKELIFKSDISCLSCSGISKGCNKEFLWTGLHPDACSVNSPSGARDKERVSCGCLDCGVVSSLAGGLCERNSAAGWRDTLTTNCLLVTQGLLISFLPPAPGRPPALDCDWLLLPVTSDSRRHPCGVAPPSRELAYDTVTLAMRLRIFNILGHISVTNSTRLTKNSHLKLSRARL